MQTVQTQIRRGRTRPLIKISTTSLKNALLKYENTQPPNNGNDKSGKFPLA